MMNRCLRLIMIAVIVMGLLSWLFGCKGYKVVYTETATRAKPYAAKAEAVRERPVVIKEGVTEQAVVDAMGRGVLYQIGPGPGWDRAYGDTVISFNGDGTIRRIGRGTVTVLGHGRARPVPAEDDWMH